MPKEFSVVKIGAPVLRRKMEEIAPPLLRKSGFKHLLEEMIRIMRKQNGVGLAANQIGEAKNVFVLECRNEARYPGKDLIPLEIYCNPRVVEYSSDIVTDWEGCLSIPGYQGLVPRSREVTVEAMSPEGKKFRKTVRDFHARIIQHEMDHLNGFFYVDRMPDLKQWIHVDETEHFHGE